MPEESLENGKIKLKLICPIKEVETLAVDKVLLPTINGDMMILPDRAPLFLQLKAGKMIAYQNDKPITFLISSGLAEIRRNLCPVLAWGGREKDYNASALKRRLELLNKELATTLSKTEKLGIEKQIAFLTFVLDILHHQNEKKV